MVKSFRFIFASMCLILLISVSAPATTYYVNVSTGSDSFNGLTTGTSFKTITKALSVATSADVINVAAGTYNAALGESFPLVMVSGVALNGAGALTTIIDATGSHTRVFDCNGGSSTTAIQKFTITGGSFTASSNGSNSSGGGIYFSGGDQTVLQNNIITRDTARGYHFNEVTNGHNGGNAYGGGIYIASAAPTIRNNVISYCMAIGGGGENWQGGFSGTPSNGGAATGGGISATFANSMTIINNTFYGNTAIGGPGGSTNFSGAPTASGGNAVSGGLDAGSNVTAKNNIFVSNSVLGGTIGGGGSGGGSAGTSTDGAITAGTAGQVSFNLYFGNTASTNPNGGQLGTNNVMADPQFVSATNFHLASTSSPAYHAGTATGAPTTDLDGTTRGSPPSIGAYEGTQPATSVMEAGVVAREFKLEANYPNPFNPSTTIAFDLPTASQVRLRIFDLLGREMASLVNEELSAGRHQAQWNASKMSSGVYFYRLEAGGFVAVKKLVLLK